MKMTQDQTSRHPEYQMMTWSGFPIAGVNDDQQQELEHNDEQQQELENNDKQQQELENNENVIH